MPSAKSNPFRFDDLRPPRLWQRIALRVLGPPLGAVLGLRSVAALYDSVAEGDPDTILQRLFGKIDMRYEIVEGSLDTLPTSEPVVVVANHPFGLIEGCIMIELLRSRRVDSKVMANFILGRIQQLREKFILVDPFETTASSRRNVQPLKETLDWLKAGHALGVFPSGTVSHFHLAQREISDPEWSGVAGRLIRKSGASVLPVFFEGENSLFFQIMGVLHPRFRTLLLLREFLKMRGKTVRIKVGKLIPASKLSAFKSDERMLAYLRFRTYLLSDKNRSEQRPAAEAKIDPAAPMEKIVDAADPLDLVDEIARLPEQHLLIKNDEYEVYCARAGQIPQVLHEIGRLRELTFREVAEGTGKSIDLDRFDKYYSHLFVWNAEKSEIVGAYRLGKVGQIYRHLGKDGLYTSTLFHFHDSLVEQLKDAIEVGRSFVRPEYQRSYSPLLLLWKGIGRFMLKNPRYHILFGPVSINNEYQSVTRQLIINFLKANNYIPELARLLKARNPAPRTTFRGLDEGTASVVAEHIEDVDELVALIEAKQKSVPVLLRQYLKLGGKLIGFNVDKHFGGVLDGLILVDLCETEPRLLERYLGKEGSVQFLRYHKRLKDDGSVEAKPELVLRRT